MTIKHIKSHSISLIIKGNLYRAVTSHLSDWQKFKNLIIYFLSKAVGRESFLYVVDSNAKWPHSYRGEFSCI